MKRLLKILTASTLAITPVMAVVACSDLTNWNTFNQWINNKDSFILYIGAKDCVHCKALDTALELTQGKDYLQTNLNETAANYNAKFAEEDDSNDDVETFWGTKIKDNKLEFRTLKADEFSGLFSDEDWAVNIKDWIVNEYFSVFRQIAPTDITDDELKDQIKTYFDSNMGTPYFITVVGGKIAGTFSGYTESTNSQNGLETSIINPVKEILGSESYLENDEYSKIITSGSTGGETKTTYSYSNEVLKKFTNY